MMTRWLQITIAISLLFLAAVPASAQTTCPSPCQLTTGQSFSIVAADDGVNVSGFRVYIDAVKIGNDLAASALANGSVTVGSLTAPAAGSHTIQVSAFNAGGETKSAALTFTTVPPPPNAPGNLQIIIQATTAPDGTLTFKVTSVTSGGGQ